jgi:diphthamide biosynthesis protein 2
MDTEALFPSALLRHIAVMAIFSTPDEHAFSQPELDNLVSSGNAQAGPSSNGDAVAKLVLEDAFEVDETVRRILDGGYKTVCSSRAR